MRYKNALFVLLTILAMAPFTTWMSYYNIAMGIPAVLASIFYGQYLIVIAAFGAFVLIMDEKIHDLNMKKGVMVGVGAISLLISAMDLMKILEMMADNYSFIQIHVGMGLYIAMATGLLLIIVALLPKGARMPGHRSRVKYQVRPGSPGSGL